MTAEHLMAIALQTGRAKDQARLIMFVEAGIADTDAETLWLIVCAPEELEFLPDAPTKRDLSLIYPQDPTQLRPELAGKQWPPPEAS